MRAELLDLEALSGLDLDRWHELAGRATAPNPFFEPEYVLPLARGLGMLSHVKLVVVQDHAGWHACVPIHLAARWHRIPVRSLSTWRGQGLDGPLGTPLISSDHPDECLAVLLDGMRRLDRRAKFVALELVGEDRGLGASLTRGLERLAPAALLFERFTRAAIRRRPEPTYFEETLGSSRRSELRRQRRKLAEASGEEIRTVDSSSEDDAYERFLALESSGWKGRQGTALGSDPGHVAFFKEMCRGFAQLGRLQLLELRASGATLAAKCNLIAGDTIFGVRQAYDESFSSYSPGMLLELDMLELFHQSEASFFDSCASRNNAQLNRLWPDRRELATYAIPTTGLTGHAIRPALATARSIRNH